MWRCPHCGAPQAESARCWVCRRSSTTCSTCRHFQTSLTSDVGWCGLDPRRLPLTGVEQRGCWQERPAATQAPTPAPGGHRVRQPRTQPLDDSLEPVPPLDFIPVELVGRVGIATQPAPADSVDIEAVPAELLLAAEADEGWTERTSLFGEPEA
jgi:hypothetical protein